MRIAMVGLGKMGMNMALRLLRGKHQVVAYNRSRGKVDEIARAGAVAAYTYEELVAALPAPRVIWLMLPAGEATQEAIDSLLPLLRKGDTIIDGSNSQYRDAIRREEALRPLGIRFADVGVSGGIWGLKNGYCMMMGGEMSVYRKILPVLKTLAPKDGFLHCGSIGAGHFVKMVHNGIEYGMMGAYGEGFDIMQASPYGEGLDFAKVSKLWNNGSVVRSWLLELAQAAFAADARLEDLQPHVSDSGEGRWTVQQAVETGVPAPVITASLYQRFSSRGNGDFSNKVLAALRNQFGGHAVVKTGGKPRKGK